MVYEPAAKRARNGQRTITLPMTEEQYAEIINDPKRFRNEWLVPIYANCPELFPPGFHEGYEMNGHCHSKRLGIDIRRIVLRNGEQYQIRPGFALPMMAARTEDVADALFLRKFGIPYWALVRLFGRDVAILVSTRNQYRSQQHRRDHGQDGFRTEAPSRPRAP